MQKKHIVSAIVVTALAFVGYLGRDRIKEFFGKDQSVAAADASSPTAAVAETSADASATPPPDSPADTVEKGNNGLAFQTPPSQKETVTVSVMSTGEEGRKMAVKILERIQNPCCPTKGSKSVDPPSKAEPASESPSAPAPATAHAEAKAEAIAEVHARAETDHTDHQDLGGDTHWLFQPKVIMCLGDHGRHGVYSMKSHEDARNHFCDHLRRGSYPVVREEFSGAIRVGHGVVDSWAELWDYVLDSGRCELPRSCPPPRFCVQGCGGRCDHPRFTCPSGRGRHGHGRGRGHIAFGVATDGDRFVAGTGGSARW